MQTVGVIGESLILFSLPAGHAILHASLLRFICLRCGRGAVTDWRRLGFQQTARRVRPGWYLAVKRPWIEYLSENYRRTAF